MCFFLVFFFFSSRRRHTRFSRDWSSDVCSSDLGFETNLMYGKELFDRLWRYAKTVDQFHPDIVQFFLSISITDTLIEQQTLMHISEIIIRNERWHMQGNFCGQ